MHKHDNKHCSIIHKNNKIHLHFLEVNLAPYCHVCSPLSQCIYPQLEARTIGKILDEREILGFKCLTNAFAQLIFPGSRKQIQTPQFFVTDVHLANTFNEHWWAWVMADKKYKPLCSTFLREIGYYFPKNWIATCRLLVRRHLLHRKKVCT